MADTPQQGSGHLDPNALAVTGAHPNVPHTTPVYVHKPGEVVWDNDQFDPNTRTHIGMDPDGATNPSPG